MKKIYINNKLALCELNNGNEELARDLLRNNARIQPNCLTLNNLGVYYCQYGMLLNNGKVRNALKLGTRYLYKASTYSDEWQNCVSLATAYFESQNIEYALCFFEKAYQLERSALIKYNIGVCLYRLQHYEQAEFVFSSLCSPDAINTIIDNGGQNPIIILAYSLYKQHNTHKCIKCIHAYRNKWKNDERFDIFYLRYLCGLYSEALSELVELIAEWYPTNAMLATASYCISRVSFTDIIPIPIEKRRMWSLLNRNPEFREKSIREYSYLPPFIYMYCFIDNI